MLSLDDIQGQPSSVAVLRGLLRSGRVPHALLFHGPSSVGKATTAKVFATALICGAQADGACGQCDCCRLAERGMHPDFIALGRLTKQESRTDKKRGLLRSEKPDAAEADLARQFYIDQIRTLIGLVSFSPRQGRRRVVIIDPADQLNLESQNALLKTLEEPPAPTVLILVTSRPNVLLPTVRSRCFSVGFAAMRTAELAALLRERGIEPDEAAARAALSGGRLGDALDLDLATRRSRREDVLGILQALSAGLVALDQLPSMITSFAGKDEPTLLDGLELAEGLLRDAARADVSDDDTDLLHADLRTELLQLGDRLGAERAATLVTSIERARGYLRYNTNRVLIAQTLLTAVAGGPLP